MDTELISLRQVSKCFGSCRVLDNVNLSIKKGESVALLGNNGSGKSTLLKMICGLENVTSGKIECPRDLKFNYVPEHFPKMNITAKQYLEHMGLIEKLDRKVLGEKLRELSAAFFLDNMLDTPMKHLSKGTLQKVAVLQSLLSKSDVLLLDEPLSGQDIKSQKHFIEYMNDLRRQGVTIIMSCHEMYLVNQISDTAYEIKDLRPEPYQLEKKNKEEYDLLVFENRNEPMNVGAEVSAFISEIDFDQNEIRLLVRREKSSEVILHMLKDDFRMLSMRGAKE